MSSYEIINLLERGGRMICSGLVMQKVPTVLKRETVSPKELSFLDV